MVLKSWQSFKDPACSCLMPIKNTDEVLLACSVLENCEETPTVTQLNNNVHEHNLSYS